MVQSVVTRVSFRVTQGVCDSNTMETQPVFNKLRVACVELGLPTTAALELIRFLTVKRIYSPLLDLSPSTVLDKLWHYVLLETDLRKEVDQLVGGEVPHSKRGECHTDEVKARRQAASMTVMEYHGWKPQVALWAAPQTVMSGVRRVNVTVADSDSPLPWGVYVNDLVSITDDQLIALLKALGCLVESVNRRQHDEELDADTTKRRRLEREPSPESAVAVGSVESITCAGKWEIEVQTLTSKIIVVRIGASQTVAELKAEIARVAGFPVDQQRLIRMNAGPAKQRNLTNEEVVMNAFTDGKREVALVMRLSGC